MGKRLKNAHKMYDSQKTFSLSDAIDVLKSFPPVSFDQTVDISIKLSADSRRSDQAIRTSVVLPHGSGKTKRILAFVSPDQIEEVKKAGVDYIGDDDIIAKIKKGWLEFDAVVAVPSLMKRIASLGRTLGTRGLMPSPKNGTVTQNVSRIVEEIKKGRLDLRADKNNDIHAGVAKLSFSKEKIKENVEGIFEAVLKAKPSEVKGNFIRHISISATMAPGVKVSCPS